MSPAPTSYDQVAYPSLIFWQSHPEVMAVIARLHGIDTPAVERARILHIGGGDGLDAIAIATSYPNADVVNIDIAAEALARGRRWSEAAGLDNVAHELIDILDAADRLQGSFDYIAAHGIYAWVPVEVRAAVMPMIGRLLAPNGVAFVSYNAMPGGYSRLAVHDMLMHRVRHIGDPAERLAIARAFLRDFAKPGDKDQPITTAMKKEAEAALIQSEGSFFHDIFNQYYAPQPFLAVATDAARNGLRYLGETRGGGFEKGFVTREDVGTTEETWLDRLQAQDYATGRYFRSSLFVRAETQFSRRAHIEKARAMWASTHATATDATHFKTERISVSIADPRRAGMMHQMIAAKPGTLPVDELAPDSDMLGALCHYALEGVIDLRTAPPCFTPHAGDRPIASPLARVQVAEGEDRVVALNHHWVTLDTARLKALLALLDGTRDRAQLEQAWAASANDDGISLDQALQILAGKALLRV